MKVVARSPWEEFMFADYQPIDDPHAKMIQESKQINFKSSLSFHLAFREKLLEFHDIIHMVSNESYWKAVMQFISRE